MEIVELCSAAQRREALPILRELYPSLDEDRYTRLLEEMVADGYRQFAVRHEAGELVAVAGAAVHVNLYYGGHPYLYDLAATKICFRSGSIRNRAYLYIGVTSSAGAGPNGAPGGGISWVSGWG